MVQSRKAWTVVIFLTTLSQLSFPSQALHNPSQPGALNLELLKHRTRRQANFPTRTQSLAMHYLPPDIDDGNDVSLAVISAEQPQQSSRHNSFNSPLNSYLPPATRGQESLSKTHFDNAHSVQTVDDQSISKANADSFDDTYDNENSFSSYGDTNVPSSDTYSPGQSANVEDPYSGGKKSVGFSDQPQQFYGAPVQGDITASFDDNVAVEYSGSLGGPSNVYLPANSYSEGPRKAPEQFTSTGEVSASKYSLDDQDYNYQSANPEKVGLNDLQGYVNGDGNVYDEPQHYGHPSQDYNNQAITSSCNNESPESAARYYLNPANEDPGTESNGFGGPKGPGKPSKGPGKPSGGYGKPTTENNGYAGSEGSRKPSKGPGKSSGSYGKPTTLSGGFVGSEGPGKSFKGSGKSTTESNVYTTFEGPEKQYRAYGKPITESDVYAGSVGPGKPSGGYGKPTTETGGYASSVGPGKPSKGPGKPSGGYGKPTTGGFAGSEGPGKPSKGPGKPSGGYGKPTTVSGGFAGSEGPGKPSKGPGKPSGGYGKPTTVSGGFVGSEGPGKPTTESDGYAGSVGPGKPSKGPGKPSGGYGKPTTVSGGFAGSEGPGKPSKGPGKPSGGYGKPTTVSGGFAGSEGPGKPSGGYGKPTTVSGGFAGSEGPGKPSGGYGKPTTESDGYAGSVGPGKPSGGYGKPTTVSDGYAGSVDSGKPSKGPGKPSGGYGKPTTISGGFASSEGPGKPSGGYGKPTTENGGFAGSEGPGKLPKGPGKPSGSYGKPTTESSGFAGSEGPGKPSKGPGKPTTENGGFAGFEGSGKPSGSFGKPNTGGGGYAGSKGPGKPATGSKGPGNDGKPTTEVNGYIYEKPALSNNDFIIPDDSGSTIAINEPNSYSDYGVSGHPFGLPYVAPATEVKNAYTTYSSSVNNRQQSVYSSSKASAHPSSRIKSRARSNIEPHGQKNVESSGYTYIRATTPLLPSIAKVPEVPRKPSENSESTGYTFQASDSEQPISYNNGYIHIKSHSLNGYEESNNSEYSTSQSFQQPSDIYRESANDAKTFVPSSENYQESSRVPDTSIEYNRKLNNGYSGSGSPPGRTVTESNGYVYTKGLSPILHDEPLQYSSPVTSESSSDNSWKPISYSRVYTNNPSSNAKTATDINGPTLHSTHGVSTRTNVESGESGKFSNAIRNSGCGEISCFLPIQNVNSYDDLQDTYIPPVTNTDTFGNDQSSLAHQAHEANGVSAVNKVQETPVNVVNYFPLNVQYAPSTTSSEDADEDGYDVQENSEEAHTGDGFVKQPSVLTDTSKPFSLYGVPSHSAAAAETENPSPIKLYPNVDSTNSFTTTRPKGAFSYFEGYTY